MFDILIRNGSIIDGAGVPRFRADLGIAGDRIRQLGDLGDAQSRQTIDAAGRIVAPGFIDVHNHTDGWLLKMANFFPKTLQGFTTEALMVDGISYAPVDAHTWTSWFYYMRALNTLQLEEYTGWQSLAEYMEQLHGRSAQNAIAHLPYANVRSLVCGFGSRPVDDFQQRAILWEIEKGMAAGAVGISTGLDYIAQCFAGTDELVEACRAIAPWGGIYATHVRYMKGTLKGVQEAVEIGRRAKVPVHISHLKATRPEDIDAILTYIDQVAVNEVDFSFDVYPYLPGCTMLNFLLPYETFEAGPLAALARLTDPRLREQFARSLAVYPLDSVYLAWLPGRENARYIGKSLRDYVEAVGKPPAAALADLLIEENLAVLLVFHYGDDNLIHPFLSHPRYMMGTDGIYFPDGAVHPRLYGSAARLLGPCVRDHRLFSLEEAVHKLSGFPASRFGLQNRGILKPGNFADVVVFDPDRIQDRATYQNPHQPSVGVEQVLVNGVPIVSNGEPVEDLPHPRPGRYLKFKQ